MSKSNLINYNFFNNFSKLLKIGTFFLSGRNYSGKICVHHRFSGYKSTYYFIDFFRRINLFGKIYKIIKDINRTAFLGAIIYENGLFSYIILSEGSKLGDFIFSGTIKNFNKKIKIGYALPLKEYNLFTSINNVELFPFKGASLSRSAGTSCILVGKKKNSRLIKFKTGWIMYVSKYCIATFGSVSNIKNKFFNFKKAGVKFKLGYRPVVRGVAKNPCDHPHGGGEGKKSKPVGPFSPWGWLTVGVSSRKKKYEIKKKKKYKTIR